MVEGNVNNKVMLCYLLWLIHVQSDGISSLIQVAVCGFRSNLIDCSRLVCTFKIHESSSDSRRVVTVFLLLILENLFHFSLPFAGNIFHS